MQLELRPTRTSAGFLLAFAGSTLATSLWSRTVYDGHTGAVGFLVIAALSTLIGHLAYAFLSAAPVAVQLVRERVFRKSERRHAPRAMDDTDGPYGLRSIVLTSFDVRGAAGGQRWTVSRFRLWSLTHLYALGLFVLAVVIPGYDAGCNVSFCAGLNAQAILEEVRRGRTWRRSQGRQILLVVVVLLGGLVNALEFALSYMALTHAREDDPFLGASVMTTMANAITNTNGTRAPPARAAVAVYGNETVLVLNSEELGYYVYRAGDSQIQVRMLMWTSCFFGPCLLQAGTAATATLSEGMEFARPGVSAIAGLVLGIIVLKVHLVPTQLLHVQNAVGSLYLVGAAFAIAFAAIFVLRLFKQRRSLYASFVLQLHVVVLLVMHDGLSLDLQLVSQTFAVLVLFAVAHTAALLAFIRLENRAIRSGWGDGMRGTRDFDEEMLGASPDNFSIDDALTAVEDEAFRNEERVRLHTSTPTHTPGDGDDNKLSGIQEETESEGRETPTMASPPAEPRSETSP